MTGLFLGGAAAGLPVLMDGFLSTVSALLAVLIRRGGERLSLCLAHFQGTGRKSGS